MLHIAGTIGTILTPIFAIRGQYINGTPVGGIVYSNHPKAYQSLGWNIVGLLAIALWTGNRTSLNEKQNTLKLTTTVH